MKDKNSIKLTVFFIVFLSLILLFIKPYYLFFKKITGLSPIVFLLSSGKYKQTDEKINFLLLGIAGGNHEGPNLSDFISFLSLDIKNKKLSLISIPRDIWSDTLQDKINSAYAYGEAKKRGGGFLLAKAETEAIVGVPIHYILVVDFEEFEELVDYLGGIDVNIERSFDDYKYPIKGKENDLCAGDKEYKCRFQHLSFKKGWQHMNGDLALKFVRSRNAEGEEGSDFARNKRQQKVLIALYEKILDRIKMLNIKQIEGLYSLLNKAIKRDISNKDAAYIGKKIVFLRNIRIEQITLSEDFFSIPPLFQYGKYVLLPKDGNFSLIHQYVNCVLKAENKNSCASL
jgi:LCP family protein required for cell wall assembly